MEPLAQMIDHIVAATYQGLPSEAVTSSKRFILDTLGAALAGSSATGCAAVAARLSTWGGAPESTIWACEHRLPAPLAAFANGMMAHAREYDDVFE
jgi:2-methylcitrate dehydratase PrpD